MTKLILSLLMMMTAPITQAYENMQQPNQPGNLQDTAAAHFGLKKPAEEFQGKVVEIIHTDSYSYLQVESLQDAGKRVWTAASKVSFGEGTLMKFTKNQPLLDFYSPTLKRKFAEIYFLSDFEVAKVEAGNSKK